MFRRQGLPLDMFWLLALPNYPNSFRWLISIAVDNFGNERFGYRKSWILPCTLVGALAYSVVAFIPPSLVRRVSHRGDSLFQGNRDGRAGYRNRRVCRGSDERQQSARPARPSSTGWPGSRGSRAAKHGCAGRKVRMEVDDARRVVAPASRGDARHDPSGTRPRPRPVERGQRAW